MSDRTEKLESLLYASEEHRERWETRAKELEDVLRVSVDDLYYASRLLTSTSGTTYANIFQSKAIRADKVLNK